MENYLIYGKGVMPKTYLTRYILIKKQNNKPLSQRKRYQNRMTTTRIYEIKGSPFSAYLLVNDYTFLLLLSPAWGKKYRKSFLQM